MSILYKLFAHGLYFGVWPYGRLRSLLGSELWRGRLGLIEKLSDCDLWLHAASVGETKIAGYLIDYLIKQNPRLKIYLTTMTTAGQQIAKLADSKNVTTGFFPIDQSGVIEKTLNKINPRLLVIAETEIWPNLIEQASDRKIPIILVNGRLSERAFKKYKLIAKTMTRLLSCYEKLFVKSAPDKSKFSFFGVPEVKISVAGDMKFDAPLLPRSEGRRREIRARMGIGDNDFVFAAGSTRPGEETQLIQMMQHLSKPARLVIAPRHINRIGEIKEELSRLQMSFSIYGQSESSNDIILVAQMGVLNDLYMAADLAFVGGTLVNIGGHNILEPVWAGTPVIFGPFTANVTEARDYILKNNYGAVAANIDEITEMTNKLRSGGVKFAIKQDEDLRHSPTAMAGNYILDKLKHA